MEKSLMILVVLTICLGSEVRSDTSDHHYKYGDPVPLYGSKVAPYFNPSETYAYFDLPFCSADHVEEKKPSIGEVLSGDLLVSVPYELDFLVDQYSQVSCSKRLTKKEVSLFRNAVAKDYFLQMYYDDLPIFSFIGKTELEQVANHSMQKHFIFTHLHFEIFFNKDQVVEALVRVDPQIVADVSEEKEVDVEFRYTVNWKEADTAYEKRMEKYTLFSALPHHLKTYRSSIMKSTVIVLLLIGCLVTFYVRVLQKDMMIADEEYLAENQEETGWKNLHADVFRFPKYKCLLAAALGSGTQLLTLTILITFLGIFGVFYPYNRGLLLTAMVIISAFTSLVGGYAAVSFYCQLKGTNWEKCLLLTGCIFCGPLFLTFCSLNTVAIVYKSTAALPFIAIMILLLMWTFLASPLLLLGGIAGKKSRSEFRAPCRTAKCPRQIPPQRWYNRILPQMALAGILPFSVVYIKLYCILESLWGHRVYAAYGFLCIILVLLLIVTAFVCMALTYYQLAAENHEWWWRSFLYGGSTGLFIYGYCLYYYFAWPRMNSLLQTSLFFGYMACICFGIFLLLGAVGFRASLLFVRHIYGSIKSD